MDFENYKPGLFEAKKNKKGHKIKEKEKKDNDNLAKFVNYALKNPGNMFHKQIDTK